MGRALCCTVATIAAADEIKQAELLAEKQLQSLLQGLAHTWENPGTANTYLSAAGENLRFYLRQLNVADTAISELLALLGK
jgi:hypothetical protein